MLFGSGKPGENACDQHGTGEAMKSAADANMRGRISSAVGPGRVQIHEKSPSDAQLLLNDAANEMGYQA